MAPHVKRDRVKLWREPSLGGIDLLSARFVTHSFARHAHNEFVIAAFEEGAEQFVSGSKTYIADAGSVLIIPPGVPHTGSAATSSGWAYRAFYPPPAMILDLQTQIFGRRDTRLLSLPVVQVRDDALHTTLIAAHRAIEMGAPPLEGQSRILGTFTRLLSYLEGLDPVPGRREASAVKRTREYLEAHFADEIGVDKLACVAGLCPSYLMRAFQRQVGMPMHCYLTRIRLQRAREMLIRGEPAARVAVAVGLVDQSHLIRRFKDAYGTTPGRYCRESGVA